jgi:hypothetical protein
VHGARRMVATATARDAVRTSRIGRSVDRR